MEGAEKHAKCYDAQNPLMGTGQEGSDEVHEVHQPNRILAMNSSFANNLNIRKNRIRIGIRNTGKSGIFLSKNGNAIGFKAMIKNV